jgi:hypothetical protein
MAAEGGSALAGGDPGDAVELYPPPAAEQVGPLRGKPGFSQT